MTEHEVIRVLLVTGPSGAGRSTAIDALEDLGFEAIDNLPLSLIDRVLTVDRVHAEARRPLALGIDVRNRDFSPDAMLEIVERLTEAPETGAELLYLDAAPEVLERRYSETRRRHPLAPEDMPAQGITREIEYLTALRAQADILIDTSDMTPHDLRAEIVRQFRMDDSPGFGVSVHSFSYKRGLPRGVDMVFDLRFLRNPHWDGALRNGTGLDPDVAAYVAADPRFDPFYRQMHDMITDLLPAFVAEGKTHLNVAMGCTGGQHRSVAVAEKLAKALAAEGWQVSTRHRELERRAGIVARPSRGNAP
ncbi:UPF0042 nucleotide-binding protein [Palleronia aestuarii]|uniref:UPF0042 nucleotide-binding protein n=1 Tax=Palleronia aestuarii TaxID=568105 RepID=A0A2W7NTI4_9RHOB|nr:RNase adapter RapZ [Palleronia aestuarii]PZX16646.1 UPF0042 nucleotide-binding protein [Palleronia aestuarii]